MESADSKSKKFSKHILIVVIVLLGMNSIWLYTENSKLKANPRIAIQEANNKLISKISELILLPKDETPTIATVTDPEKLKDQPFFAQAKTGDNVLIYTKAKKAVLYNPSEHKIVEVAPLNIGSPETPSARK